MASKATTGLVGIAVEANAIPKLKGYYSRILKTLGTIPADAEYRKKTEAVINHRLSIVNKYTDASLIEKAIGTGQVEELLIQAKKELKLAKGMTEWKPWEPLRTDSPPGQWQWP